MSDYNDEAEYDEEAEFEEEAGIGLEEESNRADNAKKVNIAIVVIIVLYLGGMGTWLYKRDKGGALHSNSSSPSSQHDAPIQNTVAPNDEGS